jgi:hypothetical protein
MPKMTITELAEKAIATGLIIRYWQDQVDGDHIIRFEDGENWSFSNDRELAIALETVIKVKSLVEF